jgi:hypothetical protein
MKYIYSEYSKKDNRKLYVRILLITLLVIFVALLVLGAVYAANKNISNISKKRELKDLYKKLLKKKITLNL